jgi:hypothetical protein
MANPVGRGDGGSSKRWIRHPSGRIQRPRGWIRVARRQCVEEVASTRRGLQRMRQGAEARRQRGGPAARLRGVLDMEAMAVWPRGV